MEHISIAYVFFFKDTTGAQLWGLLTLRLADAVVLPFNHTKYGERLTSYVDTLATFVPEGQTLDLSDISTAAARYLDAANKITEEVEQVGDFSSLA